MAEISAAAAEPKAGVRRSKKRSTRVDLTPMVDLGFLLITFFIFTTKMSEPMEMKVYMPADSKGEPPLVVGKSTSLTVIPLPNDQLFFYHGLLEEALASNGFGITGYDVKTGIGSVIREKQLALDRSGLGREEMMLMIKPSPASRYRNTVDMLDEVLINEISRYALLEMEEAEKEKLRVKGITF